MDVFEVNAVDLMNVTQVVVGHNEKKAGRGWFLHKICVRIASGDSAGSYWVFPCDRYTTYEFYAIVVTCCIIIAV